METQQPRPTAMPVAPVKQPILRKIQMFDFKGNAMLIAGVFFVIAIGIGTGFLLAKKGVVSGGVKQQATGKIDTVNEAGLADTSTFKDTATGTLEEGGIAGEGTHKLIRDGGPSQTVYLTSTVIDMQGFVGKKVTIWGQTISGKKAGWLMDVGKIKVAE
jgi:hypothetical protein